MNKFVRSIHRFLIPHERNNFRAKAIHFHSLLTYLIFFIALSFFVNAVNQHSNVLGYATDISVDKLLRLTNEEREKNGLDPLTYNNSLETAAKAKADDMFARNYWAHYAPDGTTPWSFIVNTGYKYEYAGENLAKNFMFSDGVVQAWMDSPTHRENILRSEYREIGFAIQNGVLNGEETTLVVQMFGTPYGIAPVQAQESTMQPQADAAQPESVPVAIKDPQIAVSEQEAKDTGTILAKSAPENSLFRMFYNTNLLFIGFLILAFILDLFVAVKLNIIHLRFGGKSIAHIAFLGFILAGLIIAAQGKIM